MISYTNLFSHPGSTGKWAAPNESTAWQTKNWERVDRDLRSLLATRTDECVCLVEHYSLRCPKVRFRDLQGESLCGPGGWRCPLCKTFCQHATALCGLLDTSGATRTVLRSQRLQRCPAVNAIYCVALPNTLPPERRARRKQRVKGALCSLLGCQGNRFCCYNQVGQLSALLPRILRLQLLRGHSLFWEQMRLSSEQTDESGGPEASFCCFYKRMSEIVNPKERRIL